jgi:hypothetical protein
MYCVGPGAAEAPLAPRFVSGRSTTYVLEDSCVVPAKHHGYWLEHHLGCHMG